MGKYLEATGTLAWLATRKGTFQVPSDQKEALLNLLKQQVAAAHQVGQAAGALTRMENDAAVGTIRRLITLIESIMENERQLSDYR